MADKNYILVVDDENVVLDFVKNALETEDFEVAVAAEGESALSIVDSRMPDLVILDVNLPGLNGIKVLEEIRKRTNIPVIMLSVISDVDTICEALAAGADDYICKPFETQELIARVKVQLKHSGES